MIEGIDGANMVSDNIVGDGVLKLNFKAVRHDVVFASVEREVAEPFVGGLGERDIGVFGD